MRGYVCVYVNFRECLCITVLHAYANIFTDVYVERLLLNMCAFYGIDSTVE